MTDDLIDPFNGYCSVCLTDQGLMLGAHTRNFGIPEIQMLPQHDVDVDVMRAVIAMCKRDLPKGSVEIAASSLAHQLEQGGFRSERDMVKRGARTNVMFESDRPIWLMRSYLASPSQKQWDFARLVVEWEDATITNLASGLQALLTADVETLKSQK